MKTNESKLDRLKNYYYKILTLYCSIVGIITLLSIITFAFNVIYLIEKFYVLITNENGLLETEKQLRKLNKDATDKLKYCHDIIESIYTEYLNC